MKRVVIVGGAGRMGQAMANSLALMDDLTVVGLVDLHAPRDVGTARYVASINELDEDEVDAVVDFSSPDSVVASAHWCARHTKTLVVGTTGLNEAQRSALVEAGERTGVVWATNFSLGAVLAERFAAEAAPYFERVEIIELHHDRKVDAPSGTSITTARDIAAARRSAGLAPLVDPTERFTHDGARGADVIDGIRVHSVRLPGLVAHQEVIFGGPGEGLTIRHDSYDRASFVQGVALALRSLTPASGYVEGIASFL